MEVREKNLSRSQQPILGWLRFFHLYDDVGLFEHGSVIGYQRRTSLLIIGIRIARPSTRPALDNHLMASLDELVSGRWEKGNAVFLAFNFFRDTYDHVAWGLGTVLVSSFDCARCARLRIVTEAAAARSASSMRVNSPYTALRTGSSTAESCCP